MVIALVREIRSAIGVRLGINKVQVKHSQGKIYMNKEHMEAGSERDNRQDFTINNIQGWDLITTEFKCGNLVPGISEVMWRWQKWLLESGMGQELVSNCLECYRM